MSYIQNKLDEFDNRFGIKRNHAYFSPEYDDEASANNSNEVRTFIEQALTDYHNHIVERLKDRQKIFDFLPQDRWGDKMIKASDLDILSLLQDTNPKE